MAEILTHPSSDKPRERVSPADMEASLRASLRASLQAREGAKVGGNTFGDFLAACRKLGITNDMPLSFIEYGVVQFGTGAVTVDTDMDGVVIQEGR